MAVCQTGERAENPVNVKCNVFYYLDRMSHPSNRHTFLYCNEFSRGLKIFHFQWYHTFLLSQLLLLFFIDCWLEFFIYFLVVVYCILLISSCRWFHIEWGSFYRYEVNWFLFEVSKCTLLYRTGGPFV